MFVLGLLLIPTGICLRTRNLRASGKLPKTFPAIDLRLPVVRRTLEWAVLTTVLNLLITGTACYRGMGFGVHRPPDVCERSVKLLFTEIVRLDSKAQPIGPSRSTF